MITILDGIILGFVQGIAEWLPISSEAMVTLVSLNLLKLDPEYVLSLALLLHIGTLISAIIYFRSTIVRLVKNPKKYLVEWRFFTIATVISVGLGGLIYLGLSKIVLGEFGGGILTLIMGVALLITARLLRRTGKGGRELNQLSTVDAIILGLTQAIAIIPGISRSGSTTAVALWRNLKPSVALEASFLMAIPMVIIGSTLLLIEGRATSAIMSPGGITALVTTAVVGWLTISGLITISRRWNFSRFVWWLGVITVVAGSYSLLG